MTPQALADVRIAARGQIDRLPQRQHLTEQRIERWLDAVIAHEPDRVMWHVTRLSGFGGSEIGALVLNSRGQTAAFSSARKICMQKLMILAPDASSAEMQRGVDTEPLNRSKFLRLYNASQDHDAIAVLTNAVGRYPYLRYSPDDVVLIHDEEMGRDVRILVDYKAPTELGELDEYDFEYHCQINMGAGIMRRAGIPADAGLLSRLTWQGWSCHCNWVGLDPALQQEIEVVAHDYWTQNVLIGDLPALPRKIEIPFEIPAEVSESVRQLSARIVALDTVGATLKKESEALRLQMEVRVANVPAGAKQTVFAHDFTVGEELNAERLQSTMEAAGLDWEAEKVALQRPAKYDVEGLVQCLVDAEISPAELVVEHEWDIEKIKARLADLEIDENNAFNYPIGIRKKGNFKKHPAPLNVQTEFLGTAEMVKSKVLADAQSLMSPQRASEDDVESIVEEGETMSMVS